MNAIRKRHYRVLVCRNAVFEFDVLAQSPEAACKILQRDLRAGKRTEADGLEAVPTAWTNPSDRGDAWMVMPAMLIDGETHAQILGWNGKSLISSGLPPVYPDEARNARVRTGTERKDN